MAAIGRLTEGPAQVPATKLLVLGLTRMFQPVHGYVVRRELLTWNVDQWASVNPGSIYGALRGLAKDGYLEEVETEVEGNRPARTTFRVTGDGEAEFFGLFREHLWRDVDCNDLSGLRAALSFMWVVTREEVIQAMEHRIGLLEGQLREQRFAWTQLMQLDEKPEHIIEHHHLDAAIITGHLEWTRAFVQRLRDGRYAFVGEPDVGAPWHDELAERGVVGGPDPPVLPNRPDP